LIDSGGPWARSCEIRAAMTPNSFASCDCETLIAGH
jgi:hypothetical protein